MSNIDESLYTVFFRPQIFDRNSMCAFILLHWTSAKGKDHMSVHCAIQQMNAEMHTVRFQF